MDKEIMKKITTKGYESLTIEELTYIVETTRIRFDVNGGKVRRMVYDIK